MLLDNGVISPGFDKNRIITAQNITQHKHNIFDGGNIRMGVIERGRKKLRRYKIQVILHDFVLGYQISRFDHNKS